MAHKEMVCMDLVESESFQASRELGNMLRKALLCTLGSKYKMEYDSQLCIPR